MNLETYLELLAKFEKSKDIQAYTAYLLPKLKVVHDTVKHNLQDSNVVSKSNHDRKSQNLYLSWVLKYFYITLRQIRSVCKVGEAVERSFFCNREIK